jgi:hypothetical protein
MLNQSKHQQVEANRFLSFVEELGGKKARETDVHAHEPLSRLIRASEQG